MTTSSGTQVGACLKCGAIITDTYPHSWCSACGEPLPAEIAARLPRLQAILSAPKLTAVTAAAPRESYPALRFLANVYRVMAYIVLCIGIVLVFVALQTNNFLVIIGIALYAGFIFLLLLAGSELLRVVPDIADHTKTTNDLLRDIKTSLSKNA